MAETKALAIRDKHGLQKLVTRMVELGSFENILPSHVVTERLAKQAILAASKNDKLYRCTPESWMAALVVAGQFGLEMSGTSGEAYLVPYKNKRGELEVNYQIGYRGFEVLARRTGDIATINPQLVYTNDEFKMNLAETEIYHCPELDGDRGDIRGAYLIVKLTNGGKQLEYMTFQDLERVRAASKANDSPAWKTWPDEMYRKAVIKRGLKHCPSSPELQRAIDYDNDQFGIAKATHVEANGDRLAQVRARITEPQEEVVDAETEEPEPEPPKEEPKPQPKRSFITPEEKTELMTVIEERKIPEDEVQGIIRAKGATTIGRLPSGCYEEVYTQFSTWTKH